VAKVQEPKQMTLHNFSKATKDSGKVDLMMVSKSTVQPRSSKGKSGKRKKMVMDSDSEGEDWS
jgi:hypothetical protein